jgi:hypothetical protein
MRLLPVLLCLATAHLAAQAVPSATNKPTLSYVPVLRGAVLFGGFADNGPVAESWLLRDGCWQPLRLDGPPARAAHAAAYHETQRKLVIFGGLGADNQPLADTWTFDGTQWQQHAGTGPPARALHRMTYDPAGQRVLLFGGRNTATGPHFDDTWAWDGERWTAIANGGPPARFESALAFHTGSGAAILFGGNRAVTRDYSAGALGDTWLLRGNRWTEVSGPTPGVRDHHAMVHHQARDVTLLFGGYHQRMLGDTWLFDGATWKLQPATDGPSPRGGVPAITYDPDREQVLMYGGWGDDGALRDLWAWNGEWTQVHCSR